MTRTYLVGLPVAVTLHDDGPHVEVSTDLADLAGAVSEALEDSPETPDDLDPADVARLVFQAVAAGSVDLFVQGHQS